MNEEIKIQWIDELLSGKYPQGKGALNRNGKLCCLGVLCELAANSGVAIDKSNASIAGTIQYDGSTGCLPYSVAMWAGLNTENASVSVNSIKTSFPELNDSGHSFAEIADIIKDQL